MTNPWLTTTFGNISWQIKEGPWIFLIATHHPIFIPHLHTFNYVMAKGYWGVQSRTNQLYNKVWRGLSSIFAHHHDKFWSAMSFSSQVLRCPLLQDKLQNPKIQLKLFKIRRRQLSWAQFGIAGFVVSIFLGPRIWRDEEVFNIATRFLGGSGVRFDWVWMNFQFVGCCLVSVHVTQAPIYENEFHYPESLGTNMASASAAESCHAMKLKHLWAN